MTTNIDKIKKEINKVIKQANLEYCEVCYDGECEDNDKMWLYDFIVYDKPNKIDKVISQLNELCKVELSKNIDDGDYTIECIVGMKGDDIMKQKWIDELDDEEDMMCLDWHEYHDKEPYFVDKEEIKQMFNNAIDLRDEIKANKITENRYEVIFNSDILYFICPLNAREQVKEDWKELKWLFKEYE